MGARKHIMAERLKEQRKQQYFAVLRDCPISPRKMRRVVNLIRGKDIEDALHLLKLSSYGGAEHVRKLLLSAIANWKQKNEGMRVEDAQLFVKTVFVDQARSLKRIRYAPQGRGHRMVKRSNHVTLILDSRLQQSNQENVTSEKHN